jgi:exosome complex exonuclease DIS3/RRP44
VNVIVEMYQHRETNELVEEFMLLANIAVAKQIAKLFPAFALLRRHPVPKPSNFDSLVYVAKKCGIQLNVENSKALADSLDKAEVNTSLYLSLFDIECLVSQKYHNIPLIDSFSCLAIPTSIRY